MNVKKSKSNIFLWVLASLLVVGLILSLSFNASLLLALSIKKHGASPHLGNTTGGEDEFPTLAETWSMGSGDIKAARISLDGVIDRSAEGGFFSEAYDPIQSLLSQIRMARNDQDVKAIILEVNSPGGAITPSDELYQALLDFKGSQTGRVVVVFMRDLAASGGYYVSMAGNWLIAEPTSVIGSIGVIMQTLNWKELSDRLGVRDTTIKSGKNKDLLNPFSEVPEEQRALLQTVIDSMYNRFLTIVQLNRGIEMAKLKELADGRIFAAQDAKDLGLIDQLGYLDDAIAKTRELIGVEDLKIIRYEANDNFFSWLTHAKLNTPSLQSLVAPHHPPKMQYLWNP